MKFNRIQELLRTESIRTAGLQDNCRVVWPDRGGMIFADEVLGDHRQTLGKLGKETEEAAVQQEKNEQYREETAQYITEAMARDAAHAAELDRIEAAGDAQENKNAALRDEMTELARLENQLNTKLNEVINRCGSIGI